MQVFYCIVNYFINFRTVHFEEDPALLMYITSLLLPNRSSKATCLNEDKINEAMSRVKSSDNLYSLLQSSLKQVCNLLFHLRHTTLRMRGCNRVPHINDFHKFRSKLQRLFNLNMPCKCFIQMFHTNVPCNLPYKCWC